MEREQTTEQPETLDNNEPKAQSFDDLAKLLGESLAADAEQAEATDPQAHEGEPSTAESEPAQQTELSAERFSVKALAESVGVEPEQLYGLELSLGENQTITLGELKDRAKDLAQLDVLQAQFHETRDKLESEHLMRTQAMRNQMQRHNIQLTEQDMEEAKRQAAEYQSAQTAFAVDLMPEWADETTRKEQQKLITGLLQDYGFGEHERQILMDGRLQKLFRDAARTRAEIRATARTERKKARDQRPRHETKTGSPLASIKGSNMTVDQKVAALGKQL